jgi:hypothetical protein
LRHRRRPAAAASAGSSGGCTRGGSASSGNVASSRCRALSRAALLLSAAKAASAAGIAPAGSSPGSTSAAAAQSLFRAPAACSCCFLALYAQAAWCADAASLLSARKAQPYSRKQHGRAAGHSRSRCCDQRHLCARQQHHRRQVHATCVVS